MLNQSSAAGVTGSGTARPIAVAPRRAAARGRRLPGSFGYTDSVEGYDFDEIDFFRRVALSGARALLIGRRALEHLGVTGHRITVAGAFLLAAASLVLALGLART